jgi:hypothetical protein
VISENGGAKSGAFSIDADLQAVINSWPKLEGNAKTAITAIIQMCEVLR